MNNASVSIESHFAGITQRDNLERILSRKVQFRGWIHLSLGCEVAVIE